MALRHKILLVDDDDCTRSVLSTVLTRGGFEVVATGDVQEGRSLLETARPELLIADVRAGAINDLELISMRKQPIPTIILTGLSAPAFEAPRQRFGATFVVKPIRPAAFVALVAQLLRDRAAPSEK